MDTNNLKRFATEARKRLKDGVAAKLMTLGFKKDGSVANGMTPELHQGGSTWRGEIKTETFYHQWMALRNAVQQRGVQQVFEEAAYTWFNRLVAIRILQKNDLCEPMLVFTSPMTPKIVDNAREGRFPTMAEAERRHLGELMTDDTKVAEQFAILITAFCHENDILRSCFGSIDTYNELLLPTNILAEGGFLDMLNHTEFITDEDFRTTELIGWLYQFYISERKDEVFAKKGKFEADEIPAATQIFTPNWIVKYMVQNTVGRIYLDNNAGSESKWKGQWKYLVEPAEKPAEESILKYGELTDIKAADLACGSGHILGEIFDILYDLYIYEGYTRREAIENIFRQNLSGIDLDMRAKQLATFALLLKACQKDASFADCHVMPNVLTMPKAFSKSGEGDIEDFLPHFFLGEGNKENYAEIADCFRLMEDADSLGSIMKFNISGSTRALIAQTVEHWESKDIVPEAISVQMPAMKLILSLTEKYHALVMNPPYMGGGNMNEVLGKYVKKEYANGKGDMYATFMYAAMYKLVSNGKAGLVTMESWMFLSSYEELRREFLDKYTIDSLSHFDWHIMHIAFGTAAYVWAKHKDHGTKGTYSYLYRTEMDWEKDEPFTFPSKDNGRFKVISQKNFAKIPGCPIGYWVSEKVIDTFVPDNLISAHSTARSGFSTGDNERYIRQWYEVSLLNIAFGLNNNKEYLESKLKFVPFTKGGGFRRWYGNLEAVVDWTNPETMHRPRTTYMHLYYKPAITWNAISSGKFSCRYYGKGLLFEHASACLFADDKNNENTYLAYLNTSVFQYILGILNPTLNNGAEVVSSVPILFPQGVNCIVEDNISISRQDWDAHETSWDFQENELVALAKREDSKGKSVKELMDDYKAKWEGLFMQLHENEEELNRQFIDIYGLQDELTPDVPLDEITILQQGEVSIENNQLKWHSDVVMKQLISYAVGCMMGRYRLDKSGLHIAHPDPTAEEIAPYMHNGNTYEIDDDGIMPLMASDCGFSDNGALRLTDFIRTAFGGETQVENLNFIEQCLGKTVEQYFVQDFWKDHKKMYQNRPIYWLFASKKGTFQVIAYMHRMNAGTVERIRSKYLLPFIELLKNSINDMENRSADLTTAERKKLDLRRKQLEECEEYHERLQVVADKQIAFDLDDGVIVNHAKMGDVVEKIK